MTIAASIPVCHSSLADTPHTSDFMDQNVSSVDILQRSLRVLNQKEDRNLQQKLNTLERQYRYTHKMLQQRRDWLMREHRRVMLVKICEPKATVNIAMKEIGEQQRVEMHFRASQTSECRRFFSSKRRTEGSKQVERGRSISAPLLPPPPPGTPASPVRRRGYIQSSLSLLQMKNIANIDSISEKEQARQQREAQEELERIRELQRKMLQKKVTGFIEMLKDKCNVHSESLYRNVMVNI